MKSSSFLPYGPWESRGNKVVTGTGQTIAVVFYPRYANEIARAIAELPEMEDTIEELEERVRAVKEKADQ